MQCAVPAVTRCAAQPADAPLLARLVSKGHTVTVVSLDVDLPKHAAWSDELAEEVLRRALPSGSTFLRALIDEGGTATAARLKELTGSNTLQYMQLTLNAAARKVYGRRMPGRNLVKSRYDPEQPRKQVVHDYVLDAELVPIFDEALHRLGR